MNIYSYAFKSFKQSAGKGIIFVIALAVMLISAILNIATSMQHTVYLENVAINTNTHVRYLYITEKQADIISSDPSVLWADVRLMLNAWGMVSGSQDGIGIMNCQSLNTIEGLKLKSGHSPEKINEVALPPHTAEALGIKPIPGEKFTLSIANTKHNHVEVEFVVTGIMQEMKHYAAFNTHVIFTSQEFMKTYGKFADIYGKAAAESDNLDRREIYVHFKNADTLPKIKKQAEALALKAGIATEDIQYNNDYINMKKESPEILGFIGVAVFILLATGAIVIYNAFNIVVAKKTQQFGLLTLIGASKKQVSFCVYLEASLCAAPALPLGIILGIAISYCIVPILTVVTGGLSVSFYITPWTYLIVFVLTMIMVAIGVARPARKAGSVTPSEAVKFSCATLQVKRKKQCDTITLPVLAKLNIGRNRSRTTTTILALSISGILLLSVSTVGFSMFSGIDNLMKNRIAGDIMIMTGKVLENGRTYISPTKNQLTSGIISSMQAINGVKSINAFSTQSYCTSFRKLEKDEDTVIPDDLGTIVGANPNVMADLMQTIGNTTPLLQQNIKNKDTVIEAIAVYSNDVYAAPYLYKQDDMVTPYLLSRNGFDIEEKHITFHIVGIVSADDIPPYIQKGGNLPSLFIPMQAYEEYHLESGYTTASISIDDKKHDTVLLAIQSLLNPYDEIYFESKLDIKREYERQILSIIALIILAIFIIAVIGILNLISSVFIGIEQRKSEFGILSALGLSKKGLQKLLSYESFQISVLSILFSTILGLGTGYLLYKLLSSSGLNYLEFTFPILPIIILLVAYSVIPFIITKIAVRKILSHTTTQLLGTVS